MKESFHELHETVEFKRDTTLRLYKNVDTTGYPKHWHAPVEIIMPIDNTCNILGSDTNYLLNEGDILIVAPGVIHGMEPSKGKRIIFQVDFSLLNGIKALESILFLISPTFLITPETEPNTHTKIQQLIMTIFDEYFMVAPFNEAMIYSKLVEIFVIIGRNRIAQSAIVDTAMEKHHEYTENFIYICAYIQDHSHEDLCLNDIAELSGYSKYHFSRLFKQFTGVTFYRYLNKKRIEKASILLINKELSITYIAYSCGFSSLSGFVRMFKLIKNCTPTEFKHMHMS